MEEIQSEEPNTKTKSNKPSLIDYIIMVSAWKWHEQESRAEWKIICGIIWVPDHIIAQTDLKK